MAYKVVDIYRDLPRTNCGDCGKGSCFAFVTGVYLEAFSLERCPHLGAPLRIEMQARLGVSRGEGAGRRPSSSEQALRGLLAGVYRVTRADVTAVTGDPPTVWVKIVPQHPADAGSAVGQVAGRRRCVYEKAPYDRGRMEAAGVTPGDIGSPDDFARAIPPIRQADFRTVPSSSAGSRYNIRQSSACSNAWAAR
ncbi:MAG: (Fe-S)-binding protein [Thermoleophilia bacterium]